MPITHISMRSGKSEAYRKAVMDNVYSALKTALNVPDNDEFLTITEHDAENFRYGPYLGIDRSDDLLYIQITVFNTRTAEQKKDLFEKIVQLLGKNPGVRPEDVFVYVLEAARENWSLGFGHAQFV